VPTYLPLGPLPLGVVATDRDGRFTLDDIEPGKLDVEAYKVGYGRNAALAVEVRAGQTNSSLRIELLSDPELDVTQIDTAASLAVTLSETAEGRRYILFEHVPLGGEAERAGILPGDELLGCDGRRVRSLEGARRCLNGPLGDDILLELARDSELRWRLRVRRERLRR
jgi:predicted metalloprotease with PDZ domain